MNGNGAPGEYYGPPPVLGARLTDPLEKESVRLRLRRVVTIGALALLLHLLLSRLVSEGFGVLFWYLQNLEGFDYDAFADTWDSPGVQYVINTLYSVLIVGGPFFLVRAVSRTSRAYPIPVGKALKGRSAALLIVAGLGLCMVGNMITSWFDTFMNAVTDSEIFDATLDVMPDTGWDLVMFIVSTAVAPALIEEMVFRGILMQPLRLVSDRFAIVVTAILFGLTHHNAAQIPFAVIAGLVIGYAAVATESLWTGICIHLLNNLYAVVVTVLYDRYASSAAVNLGIDATFYGLMIVGILLTVLYFAREKNRQVFRGTGDFRFRWWRESEYPYGVPVKAGMFYRQVFAHPLVIVAVLWMIAETVLTAMNL